MSLAFFIIGWLTSLLILGFIARLLAALFSEKSRNLMKTSPKRHLIWFFAALALWIFLLEFPNYMAHKYRTESKRKFIQLMQHDLKEDSRFANVGLDTNHIHFMSVTGIVNSVEEREILYGLVRSNRNFAPVTVDVMIATNFNK